MDNTTNSSSSSAKNVIFSFLAGAVVASASVYLSKKENREDLSKKLDDFKSVLFENTKNATDTVKGATQQIHDTAVEKMGSASQLIQDKTDDMKSAVSDASDSVKNALQDKKEDVKNTAGEWKGKVDNRIDEKTTRKL